MSEQMTKEFNRGVRGGEGGLVPTKGTTMLAMYSKEPTKKSIDLRMTHCAGREGGRQ